MLTKRGIFLIISFLLIQNSFGNLHIQKLNFFEHFFQQYEFPIKIRAYMCLPLGKILTENF